MRHFLFEFITGGGLSDQALSKTLIGEGEIMIQTLMKELSKLDGAELSLTRDSRLELYKNNIKQYVVDENLEVHLQECLKESDVSWLIAPETDACLESYAKLFIKHGKLFIGSSPEAIKIASSKYLTNKILSEAGVNVVETVWLNEFVPENDATWVVKPDDGVGGEKTRLIRDKKSLRELIHKDGADNLLVQPYLTGKHMSMSLLVFKDDVRLLACNQQFLDMNSDSIKLTGIGVNECLSYKDEMLTLAKKIVSSIPGFAGYIGVDLIEVEGELTVLEINPRFTTAYAGISESIGCNVTSKILNTFLKKKLPDIELDSAIPVRINI